MTDYADVFTNPVTRRAFLARMGAAGLGAAATALLAAGCGGGGSSSGSALDGRAVYADPANFPGILGSNENLVVLNFALTLETLEADLYRQALNLAAGKPLGTPLPANTAGYTLVAPSGGLSAQNAAVGFLYLQQYAGVEAAHRDFLRTAISSLGGTPVPPNPKGYTAPFGGTLRSILSVIRTAEETGVRAYLGAAGKLTDPTLVQVASSIYTTEARHSSGINYVLGFDAGPARLYPQDQTVTGSAYPSPNTFEYFQTPVQILADVKPFFVA